MTKRIFNRTDEKTKRRDLRNSSPQSEALLWAHLRQRPVDSLRFRRQYSVGAYVLDFYCPEVKLAIEIDGATHDGDDAAEHDANRQAWIEQFGIRFLRFSNQQVRNDINSVLQIIAITARERKTKNQQ